MEPHVRWAPGTRMNIDLSPPRAAGTDYGSEGWGFKSSRARHFSGFSPMDVPFLVPFLLLGILPLIVPLALGAV